MFGKIKVVGSFNVDVQAVIARVGSDCDNFFKMVEGVCLQLIEQNEKVHYTHVYATAMLTHAQLEKMPQGEPRTSRKNQTTTDASVWVARKITAAFALLIDKGVITSDNGIVSIAKPKKKASIFEVEKGINEARDLLSDAMHGSKVENESVKKLLLRKRELFAILEQVKTEVRNLEKDERSRVLIEQREAIINQHEVNLNG